MTEQVTVTASAVPAGPRSGPPSLLLLTPPTTAAPR
jgi:hypothetical protein